MPLVFQNASGEDVYLAVVWYDGNCGPTDHWRKAGWYKIANGSAFQFTSTDLSTLNPGLLAWFADWWSGGPSWPGNNSNKWYWVTDAAFNQCYDDNTNCNVQYDFQDLNFNGNYGLTVTFNGPPQAGNYSVTPIYKPAPPPHSDHSDIWGDCGDCDCDCGDCDCDCDCDCG